ncbi:MAG: alpha/beta hydrolase [Candidatus Sungbacteria bacterium]|nr:alpha/beta hydrolase [Candidatus Sungbacteria bacterium]
MTRHIWQSLSEYSAQYRQLVKDPVWIGTGVVRGHGQPVLVIPGFFVGDWLMRPLRNWLSRVGYRAHPSNFLWNAGCQMPAVDFLKESLRQAADSSEQKVVVVGHSLGGAQGKVLAGFLPEYVSHVITIGSPMHRDPQSVHPLIFSLFQLFTCEGKYSACSMRTADKENCVQARIDLPLPQGLQMTAIYSSEDEILASAITRSPFAENRAVFGGHLGLVVNREVYKIIGEVLGKLK